MIYESRLWISNFFVRIYTYKQPTNEEARFI